ncbi:TetR family transcriptional regulator C-terminal domain-containing protein [Aestuariivirga sp.]|uniref:TetR family transcriptional regulator C-terminal domain-containing protein n=1 Tax=Aestuariivirga sp. TaxID=2650926 RepID=UPI003BA875AF
MSAEAIPLRKASRSVRRQQLIESTIAVLARKGYAALTVADVAKEAGLSPGIVIFHFNSKDELLGDALASLAAEYRSHWEASMRAAGPAPAERLKAILLSDFDTDVFTRQKLAAWVAFWGEAQGRPVYDQICAGLDAERLAVTEALCRELDADGGYGLNSHLVMQSLESLGDGLWLRLAAEAMRSNAPVSALDARKIIITALAAFFPRHFGREF